MWSLKYISAEQISLFKYALESDLIFFFWIKGFMIKRHLRTIDLRAEKLRAGSKPWHLQA